MMMKQDLKQRRRTTEHCFIPFTSLWYHFRCQMKCLGYSKVERYVKSCFT